MKEANLLEPHMPLTPVTMKSVESEPRTETVSPDNANIRENSTIENMTDEADSTAKRSVLSAGTNNTAEDLQIEAWESYHEALVTLQKVQALFDNRQESYETDLAEYEQGFVDGIYIISRSDFDRSKLRYGQKLTRALINAEEAVEAAKAQAQAIGALELAYPAATDYYGYYEESCPEDQITSYLATKDWSRVHKWLAKISAPIIDPEAQEVERSTLDDDDNDNDDWSTEEVDPADSISQVDFDDYRRDIDQWEDLRLERWEDMRARVGGPEVQVGFLVRNVEALERRYSVPVCHRFE